MDERARIRIFEDKKIDNKVGDQIMVGDQIIWTGKKGKT